MKRADLRIVVRTLGQLLRKSLESHDARLVALEAKTATLEAQSKSLKFCGVFSPDASYRKNNAVSHAGGIWVCAIDAPTHPPGEGPDWSLAVRARPAA